MSYLYNDEPTSKIPAIKPTQRATPYEYTSPYYGLPDIPPPPPKKRKRTFLWGLFSVLFLAVLVSLSLVGYMLYGHTSTKTGASLPTLTSTHVTAKVQPNMKPTPKPTIIIETPTPQPPTPTPARTVSYYANDIYNDFYANGLGGPDPKNDTHWSCCTYVPAGGAIYWTDRSGYILDIATFYNTNDAEIDASDLYSKGYYSNVVHNCLLSYDKSVPTSVLSAYVQLMQIYCN